jgi:hemerythrin-like metal-binding protein
MGGREHRDIANGVIADAERAVATLAGRQTDREIRLKKLNDLFVVVEQRYKGMQDDLHDRDEQIRRLEETNDLLLTALQTLTAQVQENVGALELSDSELNVAIARSETLVAETFGTGGNANPTQPPETPPRVEPLEDLETEIDTDAGADADVDTDVDADADTDVDADASADVTPVHDAGSDTGAPDAEAPDAEAPDVEAPDAEAPADTEDLVFEEDPLETASGTDAGADGDSDDVFELDPLEETADGPGEDDLTLVNAEDVETPLLAWSDTWAVGAPDMDQDHRVLVNLVNQLPQAFKAPESGWIVGSVLNSLWDYTEYHFGREEALLRAANFPGAAEHTGRHGELKQQLREWLDQYQQDPESVDAGALMTFLKGWLMNHILGEDMRYRPYVENNPDAQAVAAAITVDPQLLDSVESVCAVGSD